MKNTSILPGKQTLVSLLKAMQRSYRVHRSKSANYEKLYRQYLTRIFRIDMTASELNGARNFLHTAPYSVGLNGHTEAVRLTNAKTILDYRNFILRRSYIVATLPEKESEHLDFLKKVAMVTEQQRKLSQYLVINPFYMQENLISDIFPKSHQIYSDMFNWSCNCSRFDEYASLPDTNSSFIDLLKKDESASFSSAVFITDDPYLSHHIIGAYPKWSDDANPAITQVLEEQTDGKKISVDCGYGTIMILDFPKKEFRSVA